MGADAMSADASLGFWALLFNFLALMTDDILDLCLGFLSFFKGCLDDYIDFEYKMTLAFLSMDFAKTFLLLATVILLVNSALFWAWKLVQAVIPWDRERRAERERLEKAKDDTALYEKLL
jgi:hypothetical protein